MFCVHRVSEQNYTLPIMETAKDMQRFMVDKISKNTMVCLGDKKKWKYTRCANLFVNTQSGMERVN